MIRVEDLQEAIAECQGQRNPNAQTCIKLAAYYTILDHITGEKPQVAPIKIPIIEKEPGYSYSSGTEFAEAVRGKSMDEIMPVIDELMSALTVLHPKLYQATIQKLSGF